jgi:WD40 repeat protein
LHNFEGFVVRSFGKGRLRARPIALSADGRRLATTSWDHSIAIWSLWNPELPVFLDGDRVLGADWMADGRTVVTGSGKRVGVDDMSGVVRTWDVATGELVGRPLVVARQVMKVLRNPQAGALLALHGRGWDGSAQLLGGAAGDWHLDGEPLSGAPLTEFPWDAQFLDGERVLLGDAGGALLIWSLTDRIVTHCLPIVPPDAGPAGNGRLLGVCATRDGSTLWAGGTPGFLHRFDRQGDGSYREAPVTPIGECINVLRLLPDGTLLLGLSNGRLQRRSAAGSDLLVAFEGHTADVRAIDWTMADGKLLIASADWSGRVRLWREDGTPIREIRAHEDVIWSVRFSPEGDRLLTACADGTARIWPVRLQIGR